MKDMSLGSLCEAVDDVHTYYPFGLEWDDPDAGVPQYRQSYNNKEQVSHTKYLDFGARCYIKSAIVFDGPDPISDRFPHLTTINYASLSPATNIDLHGLQGTRADIRFEQRAQKVLKGEMGQAQFLKEIGAEGRAGVAAATLFIPGPEDVAIGFFLATRAGRALSGFVSRGIGKLKGLFKSADNVSNPVPNEMARVVEAQYKDSPTLGAPGADDVFVTAADDIKGISNSTELAEKLALRNSDGSLVEGPFQVSEFKTPETGIASPINRDNPGFVGHGKTAGGAREFVIPNQPIPADVKKKIIN